VHFVSPSRKKFQTVRLGTSSRVLHVGNVISSRYPHVTSFVGDSQHNQLHAHARAYGQALSFPPSCFRTRTNVRAGVCVHSRFIHVLSCTNPHTYTMHFAQPLARGAIRKLYSKRLAFNPPGKLDAGRARWNVGLHVTGARFRCQFRRG